MFVEYPERNTYTLPIITSVGIVFLRYKQATAQETNKYYQIVLKEKGYKRMEKIYNYWTEFVKNNIFEIKKRKRYYTKKKAINKVIKCLGDYVENLENTCHKQYISVYKDKQTPYIKDKRTSIFDNSLFVIKEMTGTEINKIYETYTQEQILFMYDKAKYDYYETFATGKQVNTSIKAGNLDNQQKEELERIKKDLPTHLYKEGSWQI